MHRFLESDLSASTCHPVQSFCERINFQLNENSPLYLLILSSLLESRYTKFDLPHKECQNRNVD